MDRIMDAASAFPVMNILNDVLSCVDSQYSLICILGCAIDQWQADHNIPDEVMDEALWKMMDLRKEVCKMLGPCEPLRNG